MNTSVRKIFVFDSQVAEHLELLAKEQQMSMTAALQDMIEQAYIQMDNRKKIAIAKSLIDNERGIFGNKKSIQSIKANYDV